jgi:hypothetical protein
MMHSTTLASSIATTVMLVLNQKLLSDLPEVLTAGDVVAYLRGIIGRNAVYDLLLSQRIRNRRVGQKFIIPKAALRDFIECRDEDAGAGTPR